MSKPRVTIVIPTYNRAHFLRETIQSALAQTYTDFEIIIADDASTDNTPEVVASFHDSRIHYHRHSSNIGITPNWQFAMSTPTTEYIALLADDDVYLPQHLEVAIAALSQYPDVAYHTCPSEYFGNGATGLNRPSIITDITTPLLYFAPSRAVDFLGLDHPGPMNNMVYRKDALEGIFWGKSDYIPQDILIMVQMMARRGFIFSNRVTTRYRLHTSNTSRPQHITHSFKAKLSCMLWYGIRYLAQFLLDIKNCTLADIETHGLQAQSERQVIPLVLSLGSFDSPTNLYALAKRIFQARIDMDILSSRFRLARHFGFVMIPLGEKASQIKAGWHP